MSYLNSNHYIVNVNGHVEIRDHSKRCVASGDTVGEAIREYEEILIDEYKNNFVHNT